MTDNVELNDGTPALLNNGSTILLNMPGLHLIGHHPTQAFFRARPEQLIPVKFTFTLLAGIILRTVETFRISSTMLRESRIAYKIKSLLIKESRSEYGLLAHLTRFVSGQFGLLSPIIENHQVIQDRKRQELDVKRKILKKSEKKITQNALLKLLESIEDDE